MIIVCALCGGQFAGDDYWRRVRSPIEEMGFSSSKDDPDVWCRPALKSNGVECYQFVLLYTDDILAIMEKPETFLREELGYRFTLKEKPIGAPEQHLENKVSLVALKNDVKCFRALVHLNTFKLLQIMLRIVGEELILVPFSRLSRPDLLTVVQKMMLLLNSLQRRHLNVNL